MINTENLMELLHQNSYPGRGILVGRSLDGSKMVAAYFIMGRSVNSRNRIFVEDGDGIRTQAFDPSKLEDPSLIIYAPVRVIDGRTIVTNGDQTDTIYEFLQAGKRFVQALDTRTFEPDAPNYTPRISGLVEGDRYTLSILKSLDGDPACTQRQIFQYDHAQPGIGHLIHTYQGDGNPLPSFMGEPRQVALEGEIDVFTEQLWKALNAENKVSLFVRYIDLQTGQWDTRIVNKHS